MYLDGDARPLAIPSFAPYLIIDPYRTTLFRLGLGLDWAVRSIYSSQCGPLCPRLSHAGVEVGAAPCSSPGAETALWATLRTGIPSLTSAQLGRLRRSPLPKGVVFGPLTRSTARQHPSRSRPSRGPAPGHRAPQAPHDDLRTAPSRRRHQRPVPPGECRSGDFPFVVVDIQPHWHPAGWAGDRPRLRGGMAEVWGNLEVHPLRTGADGRDLGHSLLRAVGGSSWCEGWSVQNTPATSWPPPSRLR